MHGELLLSAITVDSTGTADLRQGSLWQSPATSLRQPTQPVEGADEPFGLWKTIQQGASARLAVRLNDTTTVTSLTAYRKSNHAFLDRRRRHGTAGRYGRRARESSGSTFAGTDARAAHTQAHLDRRRVLLRRHTTKGRSRSRCMPSDSDPALREGRRQGLGAVRPGDLQPVAAACR